jgi:hypothetical protein
MIAFSISILFWTTAAIALAVIAHSLLVAGRAYAETSAALARCSEFNEFLVRSVELQARPALPRVRTRPFSPTLAPQRKLPARRLLRAAA